MESMSQPAFDKSPIEHFPQKDRLHSDVLEDKYGSIHSEVIEHGDSSRESLLVDENGVARTYALTFFPDHWENDDIPSINKGIKSGGMIGKTFRENGYAIRKNVIDVFIIDLPDWLKNKFDNKGEHAKARISEFYAKQDGQTPVIYGYVLEVYTPDFRDPEINSADATQVNPSTEMLEKMGVSKDEIWQSLDSENNSSTLKNKEGFKEAKIQTMSFVYGLKLKMEDRLNSKHI
jgi:hypothetical protein